MAVERKNPSNVYEPFNNFYTQVIEATGTSQIHVAGTVSMDPDRTLVGENDMRTQVRVTMENLGNSLEAARGVAFGRGTDQHFHP